MSSFVAIGTKCKFKNLKVTRKITSIIALLIIKAFVCDLSDLYSEPLWYY